MNNAVTPEASATSPRSIEDALDSGFLPEDSYYRKTGKFREDESESTEPKESQESQETAETEEASAASEAETAEASAASEPQEKPEAHRKTAQTSESRWARLSRENRELRDRLARLEGASSAKEPERKQESQPAAETNARPKIDDLDPKTGKPKFANYDEYEKARDKWLQDDAIRQFREEYTKNERERAAQQAERTLAEGMVKKFETARSQHPDFDEVALNADLLIPKGSVTDAFLLDSDYAGEVAYYLGQHPEITQGFYGDYNAQTGTFANKITPQRQFRQLMEIEAEVSGKVRSSAKPVTQAPRPPHQVSGKATVQKDAVEQALDEQDTDAYMREANSRDPRIRALRSRKT